MRKSKFHSVLCRKRRREGMLLYRPLTWPFIRWVSNPLYTEPPMQQQQQQQNAYLEHYNKYLMQQQQQQQQQQQLHMQFYNNSHNNDLHFQQLPLSAYNPLGSNNHSNNLRAPMVLQQHSNKIDNIYNIFNNRPPSPTPVVSGFTGKNVKYVTLTYISMWQSFG